MESFFKRRILLFAVILASFFEDSAAQCTVNLINMVVREGTLKTLELCNATNPGKWRYIPSSDPIHGFKDITNNTSPNTVNSPYNNMFTVNNTGLTILNATGIPLSTSGLYVVEYNNTRQTGAQFIVVDQGPSCASMAINQTNANMSCNITFSEYMGVAASVPIFTWICNGFVLTEKPLPTQIDAFTWISTSTITANDTCKCEANFSAPNANPNPWLAKNTPYFNESCIATFSAAPCTVNLTNMVVREGTLNTLEICNAKNPVKWRYIPSSDPIYGFKDITNYTNTVNSPYNNMFTVNNTGLTILNATGISISPNYPNSTSGLYVVEYNNTRQTGAQFIVVHQGPSCASMAINQTNANMSCNITFYEYMGVAVMLPIFTWKLNGQVVFTEKPLPTQIDAFTWKSNSIIIANDTLTCEVNFSAPAANPNPWLAKNTPFFNESCTATFYLTTTAESSTTVYLTTTAESLTTAVSLTTLAESLTTAVSLTTPAESLTTEVSTTTAITTESQTKYTQPITSTPINTASTTTTTTMPSLITSATGTGSETIGETLEVVLGIAFAGLFSTFLVCFCWCLCCWYFPRNRRYRRVRHRRRRSIDSISIDSI